MLIWLTILLLILSSCLGVQTSADTPTSSTDGDTKTDMTKTYMVIENVDVLILESYPMQLHLQVTGHQTDGCELPVIVEQRREGNEIFVEIYREISIAMTCPEMMVLYDEKIPLEGGFESGTYTIHVNDFVKEITI